jgi:hypothetical protein
MRPPDAAPLMMLEAIVGVDGPRPLEVRSRQAAGLASYPRDNRATMATSQPCD